MKRLVFILFVFVLFVPHTATPAARAEQTGPVVVLAAPGDPYRPLAEEIARVEGLRLAHSWAEALDGGPATVLWVAAPQSLSDAVMVEAGLALKEHGELPAVGIITGADQESARRLWQRGQALRQAVGVGENGFRSRPEGMFAANGQYPAAGIPQARLVSFAGGQRQESALDTSTLAGALRQADYLTFTGHGSGRYLRIDENTRFLAENLPDLPPVIVSTASCQTLRVWEAGSIALGFVEQGAAAYAGFVYSPLEGFMIGEFEGLPFRYAWPDFPIGQIAALQNRGAMQGFASFPHYFLLGDPRIALQSAPPYQVAGDSQKAGVRRLVLRDVPAGLIPLRVDGGGSYAFVEVEGLSAAADGDPFFNARLQIASLGGDKLVLFTHSGGDVTVTLRRNPPWHWPVSSALAAALDDVSLFTPQNGGDVIVVAAGGLALLAVGLRSLFLRRRYGLPTGRAWLAAGVVGLAFALLFGLWQVLRLPHAAITTKPLAPYPLWLVGVFLLVTAGSVLFLMARGWLGRLVGLFTGALPALLPGLFGLAATSGINLLIRREIGAGIYNPHLGTLPLAAVIPWAAVMGASLFLWLKSARLRLADFNHNS